MQEIQGEWHELESKALRKKGAKEKAAREKEIRDGERHEWQQRHEQREQRELERKRLRDGVDMDPVAQREMKRVQVERRPPSTSAVNA